MEKNKKNNNKDRRKPYEKPKITSEKVFETQALACPKCDPFATGPGGPDCEWQSQNS